MNAILNQPSKSRLIRDLNGYNWHQLKKAGRPTSHVGYLMMWTHPDNETPERIQQIADTANKIDGELNNLSGCQNVDGTVDYMIGDRVLRLRIDRNVRHITII